MSPGVSKSEPFEGGLHRGPTLLDYLRVVRRRKWIVVEVVVLVTLAAVLSSLRQEDMYRASSQVLLSDQNLASALTGTQASTGVSLQADRVAQTQADLARVPDVAKRTIAAVGLHRSPRALLAHSSVSVKTNADLLQFSVTDHVAKVAAELATAYARQYVLYRQQLDTGALQRARLEVQQRIDKLPKTGGPLLRSLVEKDQQLATMEALQTSNASVVESASGAAQVQPRPVRNGILGFGIALVLGFMFAFLWDALDSRVRSAEEIGERLNLPLLARLPEPPKRLQKGEQLVILADPRSVGAEAFRMLRTNLEFSRLGHDVKTIMITSAVEQEGKSTSVANLGVALARSGQHVALVDLDLRRPFLNRLFGLDNGPGLTEVAIGEARLDDALVSVAFRDLGDAGVGQSASSSTNGGGDVTAAQTALQTGSLSVLASGPIPPNPGDFFGSAALAAILREVRERFDTVLIDTAPSLKVGDAMTLSPDIDAVVVVTRVNVIRRAMLNELRRLLESSPTRTLGFVVTGADSEEDYGYGGYGRRIYGQHIGRATTEQRVRTAR
jgi:succinoglycan biosynthesis transport protein ExoP